MLASLLRIVVLWDIYIGLLREVHRGCIKVCGTGKSKSVESGRAAKTHNWVKGFRDSGLGLGVDKHQTREQACSGVDTKRKNRVDPIPVEPIPGGFSYTLGSSPPPPTKSNGSLIPEQHTHTPALYTLPQTRSLKS